MWTCRKSSPCRDASVRFTSRRFELSSQRDAQARANHFGPCPKYFGRLYKCLSVTRTAVRVSKCNSDSCPSVQVQLGQLSECLSATRTVVRVSKCYSDSCPSVQVPLRQFQSPLPPTPPPPAFVAGMKSATNKVVRTKVRKPRADHTCQAAPQTHTASATSGLGTRPK